MTDESSSIQKRQSGVFLSGKYVNLTVLTETDVFESNWYDWFNDSETTMFTQHGYFPNSREMQLAFFQNEVKSSRTRLQLGIRDVSGGPIVGVVSLQNVDHLHRKAEIAGVIGEKKYRQVKYLVEACNLIIAHGFRGLNLHRIYGGTMIDEVAELMCRSMHFKREGTLRKDVFKNGEYMDIHLIGLLKEEWEKYHI